jgi:hypothetical protein
MYNHPFEKVSKDYISEQVFKRKNNGCLKIKKWTFIQGDVVRG